MTGYKTYTDGEVLVADDLNDYLQQGILRYTDKTARDADLTTNAREGMVAYTTSDNTVSYYDGSGWNDLVQASIGDAVVSTSATGSATIDGVDYDYWTYTSSGNFVVTTAGFVDVLVVGGGGGSGNTYGGGAGGVNFQESVYVTAGTVSVVVGAGGAGVLAFDSTSYPFPAFNGGSSAFGTRAIAVGGGGAGNVGNVGGSGGAFGGSGTPSQGNDGGTGFGGGGGAGENGETGVSPDGGDGGDGLQYNMNGTPTYYGGGGGAGANADLGGTKGIGGLGGGGDGSDTTASGQAGAANTGGGAGGGAALVGGFGYYGNNGGSGIVIIRVPQ